MDQASKTDELYVAGILSPDGGRRVVCTEDVLNYRHHINEGEVCFIVPNYRVPDPLPHAYWSSVVLAADHCILKYIAKVKPNEDFYYLYLGRLQKGDIGEQASYRRFKRGEFNP